MSDKDKIVEVKMREQSLDAMKAIAGEFNVKGQQVFNGLLGAWHRLDDASKMAMLGMDDEAVMAYDLKKDAEQPEQVVTPPPKAKPIMTVEREYDLNGEIRLYCLTTLGSDARLLACRNDNQMQKRGPLVFTCPRLADRAIAGPEDDEGRKQRPGPFPDSAVVSMVLKNRDITPFCHYIHHPKVEETNLPEGGVFLADFLQSPVAKVAVAEEGKAA